MAAARARGVRVCVATGRMWPSAQTWVRALGADSPAILYNGGQVLDFASGHTLYERRLPRDAARGALGLARRVAEVQPLLYTRDRVFAERRHPLADAYALDDGLSYEIVPSLDVLLDVDPYKLLVIGPSERVDTLQGTVRQAGLPVHAVKSEPVYLEILPPGVSKGTALLAMVEILGIPS